MTLEISISRIKITRELIPGNMFPMEHLTGRRSGSWKIERRLLKAT